MKDKHTINLILISSRWFNSFLPEIVHDEVILGSSVSSILFKSSKSSALSRREAPSKSSQGFTLCFQLLFLFIILLLPEFFMEALHGGSSRIPFILHLFFKTSLEVMIRQAILKIKHGAQHMFCFEAFKHSSYCIRSAILPTLSFEAVLYHSWQFPFLFRDSHVVKIEVF